MTIYASGDQGSISIVQMMIDKGVSFDRRDIRKHIPGEGARDLKFLQERRMQTVPQLFDADGMHIGGFEEAKAYLSALPDPQRTLGIA